MTACLPSCLAACLLGEEMISWICSLYYIGVHVYIYICTYNVLSHREIHCILDTRVRHYAYIRGGGIRWMLDIGYVSRLSLRNCAYCRIHWQKVILFSRASFLLSLYINAHVMYNVYFLYILFSVFCILHDYERLHCTCAYIHMCESIVHPFLFSLFLGSD